MHVGCELLDSGWGPVHRVDYHKLISNRREWNNCFITVYTRVQVERVYKSNPIFEAKNTTFFRKSLIF